MAKKKTEVEYNKALKIEGTLDEVLRIAADYKPKPLEKKRKPKGKEKK